MAIVKKREIENLEQLSGEELERFVRLLPAGVDTMCALLDFVEDELYETECNHSLRYSMQFIMENGLDFPKVTAWLNNNGGYCDCKVLSEIAPIWRKRFEEE